MILIFTNRKRHNVGSKIIVFNILPTKILASSATTMPSNVSTIGEIEINVDAVVSQLEMQYLCTSLDVVESTMSVVMDNPDVEEVCVQHVKQAPLQVELQKTVNKSQMLISPVILFEECDSINMQDTFQKILTRFNRILNSMWKYQVRRNLTMEKSERILMIWEFNIIRQNYAANP